MARVFVAVRLPAAVAERVAQVGRDLERGLADVKWVEIENLHFTLRFFGELDPQAIERAVLAVSAVTEATTTFTLRLEGLGTFPPQGRPRVIWAGVTSGGEELMGLASRLEARFVELGLGRADRAFAPHLTLGRVRDPNAPGRRGGKARGHVPLQAPAAMQAAIGAARFEGADFRVDEVRVVESRLHPAGPEYLDIHKADLGGAAAAGMGRI
jgi:2'-5' RNA ligase